MHTSRKSDESETPSAILSDDDESDDYDVVSDPGVQSPTAPDRTQKPTGPSSRSNDDWYAAYYSGGKLTGSGSSARQAAIHAWYQSPKTWGSSGPIAKHGDSAWVTWKKWHHLQDSGLQAPPGDYLPRGLPAPKRPPPIVAPNRPPPFVRPDDSWIHQGNRNGLRPAPYPLADDLSPPLTPVEHVERDVGAVIRSGAVPSVWGAPSAIDVEGEQYVMYRQLPWQPPIVYNPRTGSVFDQSSGQWHTRNSPWMHKHHPEWYRENHKPPGRFRPGEG